MQKNDQNSEFRLPATYGFVPGSGISIPETGSVAPLPASLPAPPEVPPRRKIDGWMDGREGELIASDGALE